MARIGFLVLYASGHVNPSLALARALQAAGHQITFFNLPDIEPAARRAEIPFVSFGAEAYPAGTLAATMARSGELNGPAAFVHYVERMALLFRVTFAELPDLLRQHPLDLLIVDQVFYAGATLAEHLNLPFVSLANALLVNREPTIPPPVTTWPYDSSPAAIARNAQGWAMVDAAYAPLLTLVNAQRAAWQLPAYINLLEDSFSPLLQLAQQPAIFDFPRPAAPATLHLVGHFKEERQPEPTGFAMEWLDSSRPLIYATCGTIQNRLQHVFRSMIGSCAALEVQAVVTLGNGGFAPEDFDPLPPNVKVVRFAPQRTLLQRAALAIHHAGLNSTLDCLEFGLPAVAIPIAAEQPGIAARLAHLGAGAVIPLAELTTERLQAALEQLLADPLAREKAHSLSRSLGETHALTEATRLIEGVLTPCIAR